jgi:hypothetical protein
MAEIVNLRTARKRAKRSQQDVTAAANRLAGGLPANERKRDAARRDKARRNLDQHRIETGDER